MASIRRGIQRSLSSCTTSAVRFSKSSNTHSFTSPTCSPKVSNTSRSAFSPAPGAASPNSSPFTSQCYGSRARCYASQMARLPGEIAVIQSLMPYYSATADSRLVSRLGTSGDAPILEDDEDGT